MHRIISLIHIYPFIASLGSFLIGWVFMPKVIEIAKKRNFVVKPNKRTSHQGAVPNIGGIDIFISFFLTVFIFSFQAVSQVQFIILGVFIILIVGFVDDLIDIKPKWKLIGEILSAFFLIVLADVKLTNFHGFMGVYHVSLEMSYFISFFVFLVIINALNLIDGVDGLASGLGGLYCLFFGWYFYLTNHIELSISAFSMLGSLAVFFIYNVFGSKRKIFMGDSGSLLLGFLITLFVFQFCEMNINPSFDQQYYISAAPAFSICLLSIPLFDTLRVFITRIKKGVTPFRPDKNHIHHLLLKVGLKHKQVTFVLLAVTIVFVGLGIMGRNWWNGFLIVVALALASILTLILWRIVDFKNSSK
jgi:UDP-N-acetylmuramyl pentapeptide phosphotransferase/UDP-N-acetylglucosamine-1-phosphate transferase